MMKIALCGLGRAGRQVLHLIFKNAPNAKPVICFCRDGSERAGKNLKHVLPFRDGDDCPIYEVSRAADAFAKHRPDVLIDFSAKAATMDLLPVCARYGVRMVICTTGFSPAEVDELRRVAASDDDFGLVLAPNVTPGINVLMILAQQVAKLLPDYDYMITERHHNRKLDDSATAGKIADVLEAELDRPVGINAIRAGGYVGLHEMSAVGEYERITVVHESFSRTAFANGALIAAEYIEDRNGYYEMKDVMRQYLHTHGSTF